MSEITRAEFDALAQKVSEIHRMIVNMGGQPNSIINNGLQIQPYPPPPWKVTCDTLEGKGNDERPSEEIIREDRDAWPERQP